MAKPPGFIFLGTDEDVMLAVQKIMPIVWGEIPNSVDALIALKIVARTFLLDGQRQTGMPISKLEAMIDKHVAAVKIELDEDVAPMPVTKFSIDGN